MYLNVLMQHNISENDVLCKYNEELIKLGDIVQNNIIFGTRLKIDYFKYLKIKTLYNIFKNFNTSVGKEQLKTRNKNIILNKGYKL